MATGATNAMSGLREFIFVITLTVYLPVNLFGYYV